MKAMQATLILAGLCLSAISFAAQSTDRDALKQAAREACLANAMERYGSASTNSKGSKRRIGRVKGYSFSLMVGERNRKINCLADADGETMFYSGSL